MLNERNIPLEEDGIEEEILVDEEVAITKAMWGDIGGNIENQTDLQNALDAKQDSLTESQLNAVNSGITAGKVATYDGYADQIASKADQSALNAETIARGEADTALGTRIDNEALARQSADNGLQTQIDAITSKSDVVDVVANYAALQAYDTSTLGNNDVVKVLDDETHEDALTYYRWSTTTQTWTYIGQEAPYYSKGQMDTKLAEKQDKLTAGANIQIENGTISATDTKYTNGNGLNLNGTEFSANTDVLATKEDLEDYYTKPETDNLLAPKLEAEVVAELPTTGEEGKLYLTPKAHTTSTASGNPITATVAEEAGKIESFQLDGDTFQQTYTGKNLLQLVESSKTISGVTLTLNSDGTFGLAGTATADVEFSRTVSLADSGIVGGQSYTIRSDAPIETNGIAYYVHSTNSAGQWVKTLLGFRSAGTQTAATPSTDYIKFVVRVGNGTTINYPSIKTMLEAGSTATAYEPFVGGQPSPSPDYPQQIQTVTGENVVKIRGKNLAKMANGAYSYSAAGQTFTLLDGSIRATRTNASYQGGAINISTSAMAQWAVVCASDSHLTDSGGTYTLTFSRTGDVAPSSSASRVCVYGFIYDDDGNNTSGNGQMLVDLSSQTSGTYTLNLAADRHLGALVFYAQFISYSDVEFKVQLEIGSSASSFEPYQEQSYEVNLGNIELCKLGTYQDYIYKDGDEWKVHKAVAKHALKPNEGWLIPNPARYPNLFQTNAISDLYNLSDAYTTDSTSPQAYCEALVYLPGSGDVRTTQGFSLYHTVEGGTEYSIARTNIAGFTTTTQLDNWLSTCNANFWYGVKIPTDTTITDTNLIAQLEAIRTAAFQNGTNTITNTATGTNLAGDMGIGYYGFAPRNRYDKWLWLDINNEYEQIGSE